MRALKSVTTLVLTAAVLFGLGSAASANNYPPCDFEVHVYPNGDTYIVNPTDGDIAFAAYDFHNGSASVLLCDNWVSIEERGSANLDMIDVYDSEGLDFFAVTDGSDFVAELLPGIAFFAPNSSLYVGQLFSGFPSAGEVDFSFAIFSDNDWWGGAGDVTLTGQSANAAPALVLVPEPASMSLLALGAVAMIRRRRR